MRALRNCVEAGSTAAAARCRKRSRLPAGLVLVLLAIVSMPNVAEPAGAGDLPPLSAAKQSAAASRPSLSVGPPAAIDGFRRARFGMGEEEVRRAIREDFPAAASRLVSAINPSERTTVLSLSATDLLAHTGTAEISYIFGYRSKKLIQINVLWRSDRSAADDEEIVGAANSLRDYFVSENFSAHSIVVNRRLASNAILVFRGSDAQNRTVLLVLSGVAGSARSEDKKAPRPPPLTLELSYIEDAAQPDVFRIGRGQF